MFRCPAYPSVAVLCVAISIVCTIVSAELYYVKSSPNAACLEEDVPCLTLSQYASKPSDYFAPNTSLLLLPGNHILDSNLEIRDIRMLVISLLKNETNSQNTVVSTNIKCHGHGHNHSAGRFNVTLVEEVYLIDLVFIGCVNNTMTSVNKFVFQNSALYGQSQSGRGLTMSFVKDANVGRSLFSSFGGVNEGGAILVSRSTVSITDSVFEHNQASQGGGLFISNAIALLSNVTFAKNTGAIYVASRSKLNSTGLLDIQNDQSPNGAFFSHTSCVNFLGNMTLCNSKGGLYSYFSEVTISGTTIISNNSNNSEHILSVGRGITCYGSNITIFGKIILFHNSGLNIGGAILANGCKFYIYGETAIRNNTAMSGGGIAAYQSELNVWRASNITGNTAESGGGIYAVGSTLNIYSGHLLIQENSAKEGGGVYLGLNSYVFIKKLNVEYILKNGTSNQEDWIRIDFVGNSAAWYGGAMYVSDMNSGVCSSNESSTQIPTATNISELARFECFVQSLSLYDFLTFLDTNRLSKDELNQNLFNVFFTSNTAGKAGGLLYGGLLDRCTFNLFFQNEFEFLLDLGLGRLDIVARFLNVTTEYLDSEVSSKPVQLSLCNSQYHLHRAYKGQIFPLFVMAVDQIGNPLSATIHSYLSSGRGDLGRGNETQMVNDSCSRLEYSIFSPKPSETLNLYADGPCNNRGLSLLSIYIHFKQCPIGFEESTEHGCVCNSCLHHVLSTCSIGTESVVRKRNGWIAWDNSSRRFLTHSNCPFNYCSKENVPVNLNLTNGSDVQCSFNRSGILCGSCKDGYSLTLGTPQCKADCSNWTIALLIFFAVAGVALVAFLLISNLTVAVGTISGLILYANIVATSHAAFFSFNRPNFFTVFVAWLNLDFGFPICFYKGMDSYWNVWLQFVFPMYIILLVVIVITVAHYSQRFAEIISTRTLNPVATLATLVLLSYTKLLRAIVASLLRERYIIVSVNGSDCKNTTSHFVWLVDGNINYLQGKHIALFIIALVFLLVGLTYTLLLLCWQWIQPYCLSKLPGRWAQMIAVRLTIFMDAHHAPYNAQHRYWTGLLLLVRIVLLCVTVFGNTSDLRSTLLAIVCVMSWLLLFKGTIREKIYKNRVIDGLESLFILNLLVFAMATLYARKTVGEGTDRQQATIAYISTSIAFLSFILILIYHTFISFKKPRHLLDKAQNKVLALKILANKNNRDLQQTLLKESEDNIELEFTLYREPMLEQEDSSYPVKHDSLQQRMESKGVTYSVVEPILATEAVDGV